MAFLTGGRLMDEDYYALSKLARTVFGTNDLDHRRAGDAGGHAEAGGAATPMAVTYKDVERAARSSSSGLDAEQEVPILHLRLRKAAAARGEDRRCTRGARACTTSRARALAPRRRGIACSRGRADPTRR